jgi:Mg2+-importing ATPase
MADTASDPFWLTSVDALLHRLSSRAAGLTGAEAAEQFKRYGLNRVVDPPHTRLGYKLMRRFTDPLVLILLAAALISGLTGELASLGIILSVVTLSIGLDLFQEHRADLAAQALRRSVAVRADILRDGRWQSLPIEEVVPGDVVELRAGDLVPADGIVLQSLAAHVNEAIMTGEPFPVEKRPGPSTAEIPADAFNALFAGTSVVSGEAQMLVVNTGRASRFGGIAAVLAATEQPSALERGVHRLGFLIMRLTIFLTLFVLLVHLAFGRPVIDSFLFAIALAVGLTPELLPMVMTVTLSRGALRLAARKVIVKRLAAIHDLGAMDVLCTDKTGTLTQGVLTLQAHPGPDGRDSARVLTLAAVNSRFETGIRSPLDTAILQKCPDASFESWKRLDEIPFDFERRRVSVLAEHDGQRLLVSKGAAESMLEQAAAYEDTAGQLQALDGAARKTLKDLHDGYCMQGYRVLAVAWKPLPPECKTIEIDDERDLTIAGFCVFVDPPKMDAASAVARLTASGVRVKVISGDHDAVVRNLVESLQLEARGMLTGKDMEALNDSALAARVEDTDLFARVSPDQKSRIIRALQARGHVVGFIGDGVNDAPAIQAAEVGISVEGATDVARAAADMILLEQSLGVVADGVSEGRRTFANIMKYIRMGTSSNFGNMLSMALASLVLPFLPLLPIQILLNNLLYDISEIGIPFDRVDAGDLDRPHGWDLRGILRFTLIMGALSSAFDLITFATLLKGFHLDADAFRTAWFVESIATQILVIFVIRTAGWAFSSRPHTALTATSLVTLACAVGLALTPLGHFLGFTALPVMVLGAVTLIVVTYLVLAEFAKAYAR